MFLLVLLLIPTVLWAELPAASVSLQLHRDFNREIWTSTVEVFESDRSGSTFFFTDFDFDTLGQTGSYFELVRNVRLVPIGKAAACLSVQYNDGVLAADGVDGKIISRAWLFGPAISDLPVGPAVFELQALYRNERHADPGWQITLVWSYPLPRMPLEFLGYADWWSLSDGRTAIQTEPQLQVRWRQWAVGSECELSYNFTGAGTVRQPFRYDKWFVHPTVYLRVYF